MKKILLVLLAIPMVGVAAERVSGYVKKDGTYVAPHYRSSPDSSKLNNYSTQGNVNPYTGKTGTVDPYAPPKPAAPSFNPPPQLPALPPLPKLPKLPSLPNSQE